MSGNDRLEVAPETEDDALITGLDMLQEGLRKDEELYKQRKEAGIKVELDDEHYQEQCEIVKQRWKKGVWPNIWYSPHLLEYVRAMTEIPSHFRPSALMKVTNVSRTMCGIHGGVSVLYF